MSLALNHLPLYYFVPAGQPRMFFSLVVGIYGAYIRFFMPRRLDLRTALVTVPILFLHFQYWSHTVAAASSVIDLGIKGRLFGA